MRVKKIVITAIAAAGLISGVATAVAPAVSGGTVAAGHAHPGVLYNG